MICLLKFFKAQRNTLKGTETTEGKRFKTKYVYTYLLSMLNPICCLICCMFAICSAQDLFKICSRSVLFAIFCQICR